MNLSDALNAALPEMPRARLSRKNPPRIDPDLIIREDLSDGEPIVAVYQRATANLLRLKPTQWQLACYFDGIKNYDEIASAFAADTGIPLSSEEVRTFAENMDENGFWYKNPQEKNIAMNEKLAAQRSRRASGKSSFTLAHISFSAWDPDRYFTRLDQQVGRLFYSRWLTIATLVLFLFEITVFILKWNVMGPDIPLYYNFSKKTFSDVVEFWVLLFLIGFVHESAHGLTCKHFGGEVHSMGLMFLYLTPAFYVDVTESWISASRLQRLATIFAGIWVEMMMCGVATVVWTNTQPGEWLHDFAYKIILLTGLAVVAINMNPLIKLDGYYFFAEWLGIPDLKERSTAFLMAAGQRYVFRLPVEVPVVARRRVVLFTLYALTSGAYSYLLLLLFIRFSYNVFSHWFAELALVPAAVFAFFIFRSRLTSLRKFAREFYRARKQEGSWRLTPLRVLMALALLLVFFVPLLRDRENAYYVIEPGVQQEIHAGVPGNIEAVFVREGGSVQSGQLMLTLTSLNAVSAGGEAAADLASSQAQVFRAELQHTSLGAALTAQQAAQRGVDAARQQATLQNVNAPVAGIVATREPESLLHRDVTAGETLLTVVDPERLVARLYVPVSEMQYLRDGYQVSLQLPSQFAEIYGRLGKMGGSAMPLPAGVLPEQDFKGMVLPVFYTTRMPLDSAGSGVRLGMTGQAKIFGERRSLANRLCIALGNVLHTHFW